MRMNTTMHLILLLLCLSASVGAQTSAAPKVLDIVLPAISEDTRNHLDYFPRVLELALSKTLASHGPFQLRQLEKPQTSERLMAELQTGRSVNVIWTSLDKNRATNLLPIRISLLRGLNSYRVFLIRPQDIERFGQIKNLEQLSKLRAGQVSQWPDTQVMRANNLTVITSAHYHHIFSMLAANRFDYFPRGLYEAWEELEQHKNKNITIEPSLMLHYPSPIYFFVNRKNTQLAERIELGLRLAQADGSFDKLLLSFPKIKRGMDEIKNPNRQILELFNPDIPNPSAEDF